MIFYKTLEEVPEQFRADYVESEYKGEKGFQHRDVVALSHAYRSEKAEKEKVKGILNEKDQTLSEYQAQKELELQEAREAERQKALKENNLERVLEIEAQKRADAEKTAREQGRLEAVKEFESKLAAQNRQSLIKRLSAKGVDDGAREAIADSLEKHIAQCPDTNAIIFKDSQGNALNVDEAGFEALMPTMAKFARLIEVQPPNSGAGAANGGNGANGSIKSLSEMTATEEALFAKQHPDRYMQLLNSQKR